MAKLYPAVVALCLKFLFSQHVPVQLPVLFNIVVKCLARCNVQIVHLQQLYDTNMCTVFKLLSAYTEACSLLSYCVAVVSLTCVIFNSKMGCSAKRGN